MQTVDVYECSVRPDKRGVTLVPAIYGIEGACPFRFIFKKKKNEAKFFLLLLCKVGHNSLLIVGVFSHGVWSVERIEVHV